MNNEKCPPIIRDELAVHISFNSKILQYALENWPKSDEIYRSSNKTGAYYYKEEVYKSLGI